MLAEYVEAVRGDETETQRSVTAWAGSPVIEEPDALVQVNGLEDVPTVNQLVMAGTPNAGTASGAFRRRWGCSYLPRCRSHRNTWRRSSGQQSTTGGASFFALAGDAVKDKVAIRCTELPTDRYVSVNSVLHGVSVVPGQIAELHSDLNNLSAIALSASLPCSRVRRPDYPIEMVDDRCGAGPLEQVQGTLVQGGTIQANEPVTLTITLDQAEDASFILPGQRNQHDHQDRCRRF